MQVNETFPVKKDNVLFVVYDTTVLLLIFSFIYIFSYTSQNSGQIYIHFVCFMEMNYS